MKTWKGPENHKKEPNYFIYLSVIILIILLLIFYILKAKMSPGTCIKMGSINTMAMLHRNK